MSEVAVSKRGSEAPELRRPSEIFQPVLPFGSGALSQFALSPFAMMREFTNEMDRLFRGGAGTDLPAWAPTMDVQQCNGNLVVSAELPGLKKEDVKVEVTDENTLMIQGERKQEHKQDHEGYHQWERHYGRFYRAIALPEGAKSDQVKAELKDGILKISIPVSEAAKKSRQVPVAG